jgi:predicted ferric reductase
MRQASRDISGEIGVAAISGYVFGILGIIFNIIAFVIFLVIIITQKTEIQFRNLFYSRHRPAKRIMQVVGLLIALIFVWDYINSLFTIKQFVFSQMAFDMLSVITAVFINNILTAHLRFVNKPSGDALSRSLARSM